MTEQIWLVTVTYHPAVRVAWGKRTHSHTFYRTFSPENRNVAFNVAAEERKHIGRTSHITTACRMVNAALWPASPADGGWMSLDKVEATRKRAAAKRVAEAKARTMARIAAAKLDREEN